MKMPRAIFAASMFCTLNIANLPAAPDEKFIDCGPGYAVVSDKSAHGIPMQRCKKIWCRDLENGKVMGRDDSANAGYELCNKQAAPSCEPHDLCDNAGNCVPCFGERKWCASQEPAAFDAELGIYAKGGANKHFYRGALKNNCYEWKIQNLKCGDGKQAMFVGGEWKCLSQGMESSIANRAAIKTKAVRRTGVVLMPKNGALIVPKSIRK